MAGKRIVLHDAAIADGTSASLRTGISLAIEGGRIAWTRPNDSADTRGAEVIDAGGATIVPAMVDCHSHLTMQGGSHWVQRGDDPPATLRQVARENAVRLAHAGTLWARDVGAPSADGVPLSIAVRDEHRSKPGAPYMRVAGTWIGTKGYPGMFVTTDSDGLKDAALGQLDVGTDLVKLYMDAPGGVKDSPFTVDGVRAAVDAVHARGKKVAAHSTYFDGARVAAEAGVDSIEHGATVIAVTLIYRLYGSSLDVHQAALLGAVPVGLAARLYGARASAVVLMVETLANADLIVAAEGATVSPLEFAEGLVLALLALAGGAALGEKQRVNQMLRTDMMTGLANREGLLLQMRRYMRAGDSRMTLALVHVPELTEVNDAFGYDVGAAIIRVIAQRVAKVAGAKGLATKRVHDVFGIVWREQPLEDAEVARTLIDCASGTFEVQGVTLQLHAYAAVGRWSVVGGDDPDGVIRATQRALDRAKQSGRDWLPAERLSDGRSRIEMMNELRAAIASGQLRLHYQPIVQLPSRKLRGFEALVRWEHPTRGLVPPADFIPLAEQTGLIVQLTEWVLEEVMRQMHRWDALGLRPQVAVNVGAKALAPSAQLPETVDRLLGSYGVDPARLVVEVTESDVMQDTTRAVGVLNALKALGLRIEMDDFGTGYSSLSYMRQLPLDGVKIDRSFVRTLVRDAHTSAIVRAAIDLAHGLGLEAVAEGVEDEEALARLVASACDSAQGFLFARPMPPDAVPAWLAITGGSIDTTHTELMPAQAQLKGPTVLLVDDEPRLRLATHRMLSSGGFQVISAATASEALQIYAAQSRDISLVLTDMHLTDWRGHELAARLREVRPEMRIVFMSGDSGEIRNAGSDIFLAKPFSKRELLEGIKEAMVA